MDFGARFSEALVYAALRHRGQRRKRSDVPYVTHLIAVASLVGEYGGDEEQAIAGLLHDTIEDQGVTEHELATLFGARVSRIVLACTDSTGEQPKPPWEERKRRHIRRLRGEPAEVKLVAAADKLHNASSIVRDQRRRDVGPRVWSRFRASREQVLWYYRSVTEALADGFEHDIVRELASTVGTMEAGAEASA